MTDSSERGNISSKIEDPTNFCEDNVTAKMSLESMGYENNSDVTKQTNLSSTLLLATEISFTFMDVITVFSNCLLIALIYKASKLKDGPSRLLVNQAFADGCVGILWLIVYGFLYTTDDYSLIKLVMISQRVAMFILTAESIHSLAITLLTLQFAICNPFLYKQQTKTKISASIALSWSVNIGTLMLVFLADNFIIIERGSILVLLNVDSTNAWFVTVMVTVGYLAPSVVIVVCYIKIWRHVRVTGVSEIQQQSSTKKYVRQAQGVVLVSFTYMLTFLPLFVLAMLANTSVIRSSMTGNSLFILTTCFAFLNYVYVVVKLPLFLLAFRSYRRIFLDMFCCKGRTRQPSRQSRIQKSRTSSSLRQVNSMTSNSNISNTPQQLGAENQGYEWSSTEGGLDTVAGASDGGDNQCSGQVNKI